MTNQLSGVAIIICIAFGFTTFVLIFIFGKRQIMRFALKSRRGPHVPIAADAPKYLKKEIDRRFDVVNDIKFEPQLLDESNTSSALGYDHAYRMRAVDDLKKLERALTEAHARSHTRPPGQDLKFYASRMAKDGGPLCDCDPKLLSEFLDLYYHARHEPEPVFNEGHFNRYSTLLKVLIDSIIQRQNSRSREITPGRQVKDTSVTLNGKKVVRVISPSEAGDNDVSETSV